MSPQVLVTGGSATVNAIACLVKAVELDPASSHAWLQLGKLGGAQVGARGWVVLKGMEGE